jgi:hypothetical protein
LVETFEFCVAKGNAMCGRGHVSACEYIYVLYIYIFIHIYIYIIYIHMFQHEMIENRAPVCASSLATTKAKSDNNE